MRTRSHWLCTAALFVFVAGAAAADAPPSGETAAEKLRKALDRARDLEIADQPLDHAVNQLREQTGINLVIDQAAVPASPLAAIPGGLNPAIPSPYAHLRVGGVFHGLPVRAALAKMLRGHGLAQVLVGDTVLVTRADKAADRQLGQAVSVHVEGKNLGDVLKRLARETGANLVLDPRAAKEGGVVDALRLDEVPLETAVNVLAEAANLRAVRLGNVLYVTTEARAEKLKKSQPAPAAAPPAGSWQVWPDGNGGFRLAPPAGAGIVGLGGMGGIAGLAGGGFNAMGALGAGGGFAGLGGAPVRPVPLTPPAPGAKPKEEKKEEKPKDAKPGAAPAGKDKPQPQALRPHDGEGRWPLVLALAAFGAPAPAAKENNRKQELVRAAHDLLEQPIKFPGFDDPKTTLSEALEALSKRYNLSFDINEEAFKEAALREEQKEGAAKPSVLREVAKIEIATPNPVPEMHTRLRTVLKKVLGRVSPSATYLIREDVIEITTTEALREEFYPHHPPGRLPPLVHGTFDGVPLQSALKELAGWGNIVLDRRLAREATAPVTAELANVPLDTAVRMLADMAGLQVVPMDNALYVTSKENARALMGEQQPFRLQDRPEEKPKTPPPADKPAAPPPPKKTETANGKP